MRGYNKEILHGEKMVVIYIITKLKVDSNFLTTTFNYISNE